MRIGCHVSISGGIHCAVDNASKIDGTAFQIFTRNPRGWNAKEITDSERDLYKSKLGYRLNQYLSKCAKVHLQRQNR